MRILFRLGVFLLALATLAGAVVFLAISPPAPLHTDASGSVLRDLTVVNPGHSVQPGHTIRIESGRIAAIEPSGAEDGSSPYSGTFALPGLVDMHVHLPPPVLGQTELHAFLYLYHGVTTVREAFDFDGSTAEAARAGRANGDFPSPRIFSCGPLLDGVSPQHHLGSRIFVRSAEDADRAVDAVVRGGFECVKAFSGLSEEALAAIRRAARERGLRVLAHVPTNVGYERAMVDEVQHFTGLPHAAEEGVPFPYDHAIWADLDEARLEEIVSFTLEHGIANTPTLVSLERMVALADDESLRSSPDLELLPRVYRDVLWSRSHGMPVVQMTTHEPGSAEILRTALEGHMRLLKHLYDAGAPVYVGTDSFEPFVIPGFGMYREMRLWVEAGLRPEQVWEVSTRAAGDVLGVPGLGRLERDAPADLLLFERDPTRDLDALDSLVAVVADGRIYPRQELEAQLARYRGWAEQPVFDRASVLVARNMLSGLVEDSLPEFARSDTEPRRYWRR